MASGVKRVSRNAPPRWLETLLRWCLPARDRDSISGDLLEEYREAQLPQLGSVRANLWYLRQLISFLAVRSFGGSTLRASLTWMSVLITLAGIWLGIMEQLLKHPGYAARSVVAAAIATQGLATIFFLMWHGQRIFRALVLAGAMGVVVLGASAVIRMLNAAHFEGFVLLIGAALMVQGVLAGSAALSSATPHR